MSVVNPVSTPVLHRRSMRFVAAGIAAAVAFLYLVLFLVLLPRLTETDNPAPVFAVLAVAYAVLSLLLAKREERVLLVVGAVVQAFLVGGYLWLFAGSALADDEWFFVEHLLLGVAIAVAQVVLGVLLVRLARSGGPTPSRSADG